MGLSLSENLLGQATGYWRQPVLLLEGLKAKKKKIRSSVLFALM